MSDPIAFFISFTCYGSRLHGDSRGTVDLDHNIFGTPVLPANANRVAARMDALKFPPYSLEVDRPWLARDGIVALAAKRCWTLWAVHVRTEHLHVVVSVLGGDIDRVMNDCKSAASFRLNRAYPADKGRRFWTRHGSTRNVWNEAQLAAVIDYVLNQQGEPMAVYKHSSLANLRPSEPRT